VILNGTGRKRQGVSDGSRGQPLPDQDGGIVPWEGTDKSVRMGLGKQEQMRCRLG
jgi:hypothetical protein